MLFVVIALGVGVLLSFSRRLWRVAPFYWLLLLVLYTALAIPAVAEWLVELTSCPLAALARQVVVAIDAPFAEHAVHRVHLSRLRKARRWSLRSRPIARRGPKTVVVMILRPALIERCLRARAHS